MNPSIQFTIVCLWNEERIVNDWLFKSLKEQTSPYQVIAFDNRKNIYSSAAEGLNALSEKVETPYIIFIHQDVKLLSPTWLADAEMYIKDLSNFALVGVCGKPKKISRNTSVGVHGIPPRPMGKMLKQITLAQSLDECLIIAKTDRFKKNKFDSLTCDDWHLYSADYCYSQRSYGYKSYLLPLPIHHRSTGLPVKFSFKKEFDGYYRTLRKLLQKHKKSFIFTTSTGIWFTRLPLPLQRFFYVLIYKILPKQ